MRGSADERGRGPRDVDELFEAERAALVSFARSLVGDDAAAEDVVQNAFLACVRKAGQRPDDARTWLWAVVHKEALRHRRDRGRRPEVDLASAGEAYRERERPDQILQSWRVHGRVAEELARLPPSWRAVVHARLFDGLRLRDVAREIGIPFPTARTHYHRGVARLRERLEPERIGGVSAWVLFLRARGLDEGNLEGEEVPGAAGRAERGRLGLGARLAAGAALGGAVLWLALAGRGADAVDPSVAAATPAPPSNPARARDDAAGAGAAGLPERSPARRALEPASPTRAARGRLVGVEATVRRGEPVHVQAPAEPGFQLTATLHDGGVDGPVVDEHALVSDPDGRVRIELEAAAGLQVLVLDSGEPGFLVRRSVVRLVDGVPETPAVVLRAFPLDDEVLVHVVDPQRRPVAGARVADRAFGRELRTDAAGRCRVPTSSHLVHSTLVVEAEGIGIGRVAIDGLPAERRSSSTVVLRPGQVVRGRVLDRRGAPVAGALVGITDDPLLRTRTDSDGGYELAGVHGGPGFACLFAHAAGHARHPDTLVRLANDGGELDFELEPERALSLRVLDGTVSPPRPLHGSRAYLHGANGPGLEGLEDVTDAAGHAELRGLTSGPERVVVVHPGRGTVVLELPAGHEPALRREVVLGAASTFRGRLVGPAGREPPAARMKVSVGGAWLEGSVVPDASGSFAVHGLPASGALLEFGTTAGGNGLDAFRIEPWMLDRTGAPVSVPTFETGAVRLRVAAEATGEPLEEVRLRIAGPDGIARTVGVEWTRDGVRARTSQGTWSSRDHALLLPVGLAVVLEVGAPGFATEVVSVVVRGGEVPGAVDVALERE